MRLLRKDRVMLRRLSKGYYTEEGTWAEGGYIDEPILCGIQPDFTGNVRFIEEMGVRSEDCLTIHTTTPLRTINEFENTQADRIIHEGYVWEVQKVKPWKSLSRRTSHYEVLAFRQDKDSHNGSA